jgi:antitoxin component YwqK of YwqJK toxin-antitoxin module
VEDCLLLKKRPELRSSAVLVVFVVFFLGLSLSPYFEEDDVSALDSRNPEKITGQSRTEVGLTYNRTDVSSAVTLQMSDLLEDKGLFYYPRDAEYPFTGAVTGGLERGLFINGMREGPWSSFYENGQLRSKGKKNYGDGERQGFWVEFYENGQLWLEGEYKNGKRHGDWLEFHENGEIWFKGKYKNGKEEGPWLGYWKNGQLRAKGKYKNGKEEGPWLGYWENGQLRAKGKYRNGKEEGLWFYYNRQGAEDENFSGTYRNGAKASD